MSPTIFRGATWNVQRGGYSSYGTWDRYPKRMPGIIKAVRQMFAQGIHFVVLTDTFRWGEVYSDIELGYAFSGKSQTTCRAITCDTNDMKMPGETRQPADSRIAVTLITTMPIVESDMKLYHNRHFLRVVLSGLGSEVDLYCPYLDHNDEDRRIKQIDAVLADAQRSASPTIIAGDFNSPLGGIVPRRLKTLATLADHPRVPPSLVEHSYGLRRLRDLRDPIVAEMLTQSDFVAPSTRATSYRFPIVGGTLPLDYLVARNGRYAKLEITEELALAGIGRGCSDHRPICATFSLPS